LYRNTTYEVVTEFCGLGRNSKIFKVNSAMESVLELHPSVKKENSVAIVRGEAMTQLPKDLYIPPQALRIFLEAFEGPLDLLLYLIKKQNMDILDISIAEVTRQYMGYVELMQELNLELAAEYLVMAAFLAEIKSRLLLPRSQVVEAEEGGDPRAELISKLQEYERFKKAAEDLNNLPQIDRDIFAVKPLMVSDLKITKPLPKVEIKELLNALVSVFERTKLNSHHRIQLEPLSIHERMVEVLNKIRPGQFVQFSELFSMKEGRLGVVVTFIVILELIRQSLVEIVQAEPFSSIHIKAVA
jgi:segregation and condensation protein A